MNIKKYFNFQMLLTVAVVILSVVADQITKLIAVKLLAPDKDITVINNVLNFTYTENKGAAFGMLDNQRWIFIVATVVFIAFLVFALIKGMIKGKFGTICVALIIGGGIGNLIDRVLLGYVVDFINFKLIYFICPAIFNVADMCVVIGAILGVIWLLFLDGDFGNGKSENKGDEQPESKA